ncbi:outer membrane protein [Celeribacter indicus]|uniref:Outer membrane protein n=1 Tax=Celeribacter indicus TaxID=1208324 RepID=A0A0B5DV63_9RHOB|nr:porin [Celeribacter indicus]AJE45095.1 outer membrane protein [Celeribacter indicus]SDX27590.1 outer membrane autotransporter barrel domain-containing protein [Celeribacter indicus]
MKRYLIVSALALGTAAPAFAGGYSEPVIEPAPAPVAVVDPGVDWTGFYAGLQYGQGTASLDFDDDILVDADDEDDFDAYGLHAGYMWDFGQWVAGAELDYNKADFDEADEADLVRLRGRAGYDLGRFLPYVTLGVANISSDFTDVIDDDADFSETGVTYGIGVDYLVSDRFSVGLEYSKQDFDEVEEIGGESIDLDAEMVQIRAAYRF